MIKKTFFLLSFLMITSLVVLFADNNYKSEEVDGFTFEWYVDGEDLHIRMTSPAEGWIAVGFNPSRAMKDADYKLAYVDGSTVVMEDHFGTGMFGHKDDTRIGGQNDFQLISGIEENGKTIVEFTMPLNSGDQYDSVLAEGEDTKVLLAYANTDNMSRKHKWRTSFTVRL